jgi:ADP-ribose pyrophosphatase YjhB (NUDIX family)
LPARARQISPSDLHLSSFLIAKKKGDGDDYSVLFLKAGDKHPLSFRRGKFVLPSTILNYGEKPKEAVRRAIANQIGTPDSFEDPQFQNMQTFFGAHWDIVFLFESWIKDSAQGEVISPKEPYVEARFYPVSSLPRNEISEDHLEVLDEMLHPSDATP